MVISCRFGLLSVVVGYDELRVCHTFDGVVARVNELLDISCGDSVYLLFRSTKLPSSYLEMRDRKRP